MRGLTLGWTPARATRSRWPSTSGMSGIGDRRTATEPADRPLEETYDLADALVVAMHLNAFVRHAPTVRMANLAQLVNVIAPIVTGPDGVVLQTIFHPFELFSRTTGRIALDAWWDGDTFSGGELQGRPDARCLLLDRSGRPPPHRPRRQSPPDRRARAAHRARGAAGSAARVEITHDRRAGPQGRNTLRAARTP